jgi:hypothetical protein
MKSEKEEIEERRKKWMICSKCFLDFVWVSDVKPFI